MYIKSPHIYDRVDGKFFQALELNLVDQNKEHGLLLGFSSSGGSRDWRIAWPMLK